MPEISIIIPILNSASTLNKCLESVRSQTFSDWEAICIYDNSDDNSMEIIQNFVRKDSRFIFIQGRNKLLAGARNDGIKKSKGKYIFFLDSDDSLVPNAFERCVKEFQKRYCDIVIFGTDIVPKNPRASNWHYMVLSTPNRFYKQFSTKALFGEDSARPFVWRNAYTKQFLERSGVLFDETCAVGEDQVFQICAFPHAENGISFIKDKLYQYTWNRSGSLMSEYDKDILFKMKGHIQMVDSVFSYWNSRNYDKLSKKDIAIWAVFFLGYEIPYLKQEIIDKLSIQMKELFAKWFDEEVVFQLPSFCQKKSNKLQSYVSLKQNKWYNFRELLLIQYFWGGLFYMINLLAKKVFIKLKM